MSIKYWRKTVPLETEKVCVADIQKRHVMTWQNKGTKELKYCLLGVKTKRGYRLSLPETKPNEMKESGCLQRLGDWEFVMLLVVVVFHLLLARNQCKQAKVGEKH